jgi:glycine betaine catabolism B
MAKKAKVSVRGYFKDLMGWFGLMKARQAWIDAADTDIDLTDYAAELSHELHPGLVKATIVDIKDETPSSRTFTMSACERYKLPFFYAGQHMSVKFCINGKWTTRPFSISSAPLEADKNNRIQITLRRKPGGYVSTWVWDNWKVGSEVVFDGAFGEGYYNSIRDSAHAVGIAGGSGITAFRSIALDMADSHRPAKFTILYGSRNQNDIIFYDELKRIADESGGAIELHCILSEPSDGWDGETGFISADIIKRLVPDWDKVSYYVSGPQAMYDYLDKEFAAMGIRSKYIRKEEYGETDDITESSDYPKGHENDSFKIKVLFGNDEQVIDAKATDTIAVSLEKAGVAVDTHCRSGACGFCRSLLMEGDVWQRPQSNGVRAADKDDGYFHPCSAYPMSDITIKVCSRLG